MFSPLDGIRTCRGGVGLRPSSTHFPSKSFSISCISKIYVSVFAVVLSIGGVVHVILAMHGERSATLISLGGKGRPAGEETDTLTFLQPWAA